MFGGFDSILHTVTPCAAFPNARSYPRAMQPLSHQSLPNTLLCYTERLQQVVAKPGKARGAAETRDQFRLRGREGCKGIHSLLD